MTRKSTTSLKGRAAALFRLPRSRARRFWLGLFLVCAAGLFATLAGATLWIASVSEDSVYHDLESLPANDVGLLLGTSKRTRAGYSNFHFHSRVKAAAELLERGKIKHILASGDNNNRHYDEPSDMRDALMKRGVPASAITLDYAGFRTLDSVVRAKKVFGLDRFTIISQEYHNSRAVFIAKHYGCDVAAFCADPVDFRNSVRTEIREYFARVKAVLDLYVLRKQPIYLGEREIIRIQSPSLSPSENAASEDAQKERDPDNLGALLENIRQKHELPAMAAAVLFQGRVAGLGVAGTRKKGEDIPAAIDDAFHIGSCTKAMTATLVALLVEKGKLRWDLTLAEAFPELAEEMHSSYRNVTLKHLLSHRAGLAPNHPKGKTLMDLHRLPGSARERRETYVRMMLTEPPRHEPGTKHLYSNAGYAVAAAVAERVADTPWERLMEDILFRPLGMETAGFGAMGEPGEILQPWQHRVSASGRTVAVAPGPLSDNPPVMGPAGRVHCSVRDWAKFVQVHLQGARGKKSILKPDTFKVLHIPQFGGDYAMGWVVTERPWGGGQVLTHSGSNTMNYAVVWLAPHKDFAVLAVANQGGDKATKACDDAAAAMIRKYLKNK